MKPCASQSLRISSPIGPSSTLRMCSVLRNRNGMVGTMVAAQMLFIGATLTRVIARAPSLVCSIVSFSLPSADLANTLTLCLPLERLAMSSPMWRTACTVG